MYNIIVVVFILVVLDEVCLKSICYYLYLVLFNFNVGGGGGEGLGVLNNIIIVCMFFGCYIIIVNVSFWVNF